ncbi:protein of unknown function DUF217 [Archaeoglobus veneficus SNP6]|uniref:Antitoxin n=1 Tax=Archaeoglobus veneficus (strain DSM 11195 / SNP6) TaxID=693661 RepID=F2KMT6_ARCVS|nr:protein of unknown function DUF217 [Archaeoglobus veneficus SNP6]
MKKSFILFRIVGIWTSINFYSLIYNTLNMKTITISDDVYEKLARIKGKKSFSAVIDELIKKNVEKRIEMLIKSAVNQ